MDKRINEDICRNEFGKKDLRKLRLEFPLTEKSLFLSAVRICPTNIGDLVGNFLLGDIIFKQICYFLVLVYSLSYVAIVDIRYYTFR